MKLPSLTGLSFDSLLRLRDNIESIIAKQAKSQRKLIEIQLARLSSLTGGSGKRGRPPKAASARTHALAGRKVLPKYRNPNNAKETWAGRGMKPKWMAALLKEGRDMEEFAIKRGAAAHK